MSNFENYDFILHDGVVIENEKADKEGRKKRMSACLLYTSDAADEL